MAMEEMRRTMGRKKGGLKAMPFIFANEVAEKLAVVGFSTNMLTYLTTQLHMPLAKAATTLTNFGGTSAATPLIGAFLADACIGRFWTIAAASIVYQVGMALLTVSAVLPLFRPPPCKPGGAVTCQEAAPWQLAVLYVSLLLNAFGAGGYRPCIVAFGADQFDESGRRSAPAPGASSTGTTSATARPCCWPSRRWCTCRTTWAGAGASVCRPSAWASPSPPSAPGTRCTGDWSRRGARSRGSRRWSSPLSRSGGCRRATSTPRRCTRTTSSTRPFPCTASSCTRTSSDSTAEGVVYSLGAEPVQEQQLEQEEEPVDQAQEPVYANPDPQEEFVFPEEVTAEQPWDGRSVPEGWTVEWSPESQ